MRLYLGGFGQGKLTFVSNVEGIKEFFDGEKDNLEDIKKYRAINKLNLLIKRLIAEKIDVFDFIIHLDVDVIICDTVGNGITPTNRQDEEYRNYVGRSCHIIAEKSETVVRIISGRGQVIK